MRFWIGRELEGRYKGINTLFVQCENLQPEVFEKIKEILKTEKVGQIYFGAGSKNVDFVPDFYYFQLFDFRKDYLLTVETSVWQDWYKDVFNNIILTYDNLPDCPNLNIKVKNKNVVYTFPLESGYKTDLSNLERDMFSGVDREIKI